MEPTERNPLDLLYLVALGSPTLGVPSPPSAHSSLSNPAIVRADLVSFEKRITSHFNGLLGASSLRMKRLEGWLTFRCAVPQVCLS